MSNIIKRSQFEPEDDGNRPPLRAVRGKKTIEQWLQERAADVDKESALSALVLEHLIGTAAEPLHTRKVGSNVLDIKETARLFLDVATSYCQDLTGNHTFRILAFYGDEQQPQARHIFAVAGQQDPEFLGQESPDQKGLLSHGLAYSSKLIQMSMNQMAQLFESVNENMRIMSTANSRLLAENYQAFEVVKTMLLDKAVSEREQNLELAKYQRQSGERQQFLQMIPGLVNQVTGRKIFPDSVEDSSIIEGIAKLDPDDLAKLVSVVSKKPALMATLASRLNEVNDSKQQPHTAEEKLAKVLPPEDDFESLPPKTEDAVIEPEPPPVNRELDDAKARIAELESKLTAQAAKPKKARPKKGASKK